MSAGGRIGDLLAFTVDGAPLSFTADRLVVAGFTARDRDVLMQHIDELAREGIPRPSEVPLLWEVEPALLTVADTIEVASAETSGEVEPVLVLAGGRMYVGVGSDHTDRGLERVGFEQAKQACSKVVSRQLWPYEAVAARWDALTIRSCVQVDGGEWTAYQEASLNAMLPVEDVLARIEAAGPAPADGTVVFLGTPPLLTGAPIYADAYRLEFRDNERDIALTAEYRVAAAPDGRRGRHITTNGRCDRVNGDVDRSPATGAKPEIEFTSVDRFPWTPVPNGVEDLNEAILASGGDGNVVTRLLRFGPGCDTTPAGVQCHDFWEEVYVLEGELHDLTLDEMFSAGSYACRPPGMPHGPWRSPNGCVTFEVRYRVDEKAGGDV
jgi:hypothetical protein